MADYPGPTTDNLACLPATLRARPQWVLWRGADRIDTATGVVKLNKIPIDPQTLANADSTDPSTWGTFDACIAALPLALEEWEDGNPGAYRGGGIGYVFAADDPYVGVDLDGCVDPDTGVIASWAQQYIDTLQSYTEITPSGTGVHIIVEGTLPPKGRRKGQVEMYDYARFFTMTGWHLDTTSPAVEPRTIPLQALWCRLFGPQVGDSVWLLDAQRNITNHTRTPWMITGLHEAPSGELYAMFHEMPGGWPALACERAVHNHGQPGPSLLTDDAVIAYSTTAKNSEKVKRLASGDWKHEFTSQSEADLSLCCMLAFWTQDAVQIDRLFRQTGLMRPKWDEKRGDSTYGERTVAEALARQTEHHWHAQLKAKPSSNGSSPAHVNDHGTPAASASWGSPQESPFNFDNAVNARALAKMMAVPPRFLIHNLIPDGLTILAAPAKSYKSYFSLSLALATVGAGDWCDTFPVEQTGNVVFFGLESPLTQLRNRMFQLRPQLHPEQLPHELIFFSGMKTLPPFRDGLQQAVEAVIERYTPRLIVIDPMSYLYRLGRQDDLASATLDLLWPLAEMAAKAKVAIVAPEHMRKRSKEDVSVVDQLAGSHIKAAVVHALLMLTRQGDDIVIETTMRDAPSQELALTLTFDAGQHCVYWGYKGSNQTLGDSRREGVKRQVYDILKSRGYPMNVADIISECGLLNTEQVKSNVRQILRRAETDGDVACSKRGEYYWIGQKV